MSAITVPLIQRELESGVFTATFYKHVTLGKSFNIPCPSSACL